MEVGNEMEPKTAESEDKDFLELLLRFAEFEGFLAKKIIKAVIDSANYPFENSMLALSGSKFTFEEMITDPEKLFALGFSVPFTN